MREDTQEQLEKRRRRRPQSGFDWQRTPLTVPDDGLKTIHTSWLELYPITSRLDDLGFRVVRLTP